MKIKEVVNCLEKIAPLQYQESYDNSGLQIGSYDDEISAALVTLDVTEDVIDEAIENHCDIIISHHPLIFGNLKKINGNNFVERCILKAIRNNIALYACHTNLDNVEQGVNRRICDTLQLVDTQILEPMTEQLSKLVVYVPNTHVEIVRNAICEAGGGNIGNYDFCTYNTQGIGTFRAKEGANPYCGNVGSLHLEPETKIETVVPNILLSKVIKSMLAVHPYEEVAYDIFAMKNEYSTKGSGMIGRLKTPMLEQDFLQMIKEKFCVDNLRYTNLLGRNISKVAVCGGAGISLLSNAIQAGADIFITADVKYHDFFRAENRIILTDIGHYESEQFTKNLIYEEIVKNLPKFAIQISKLNSNPVKYL